MKIISLVGARPQFIKEAVLNEHVRHTNAWHHVLVHSGQHYDAEMSDVFFQELHIPTPAYNLQTGSGSHAQVTAAVLTGMEKIILKEKPDALLVYGDTNTTLGGALAAAKIHVPVIHVEAGIRMLPADMPEEINRRLTDRLASVLCCCSSLGADNLYREGITDGVEICGDIMLDVYKRMSHKFDAHAMQKRLGLSGGDYIVATLHRDYNVDVCSNLSQIIEGLKRVAASTNFRVILPLHPRTRKKLVENSLVGELGCLEAIDPLGYIDLMSLVKGARFIVTDSGGLQKEAFYSGKRSVVIMPDTGWRELTGCGWNIMARADASEIQIACRDITGDVPDPGCCYGNGETAAQIVKAIKCHL